MSSIQVVVLVAVLALLGVRLWRRARARSAALGRPAPARRSRFGGRTVLGDVGLVAGREIHERLRGRALRLGTAVLLAVVAAAVVVPVITRSPNRPQRVAVVGELAPALRLAVVAAGAKVGTRVQLSAEPDLASARAALRRGRIDLAVVDGRSVVADKPVTASSTSTTAQLARAVAQTLGVDETLAAAGLTRAQVTRLLGARPLPITNVQPGPKASTPAVATSIIGAILVFVMLSQYCTWTLIGVMEEKSSRVVEVLLAALRPVQLLAGKVLGIATVALGQAAVVVAFALVLADAVGSDLVKGTAPLQVVAALVWLVLGYAFYCWVYAAAGSTVERQDQVQSLALPLSLPMIVGYVLSLTVASSGHASAFFIVLAYLPPTAPFAMPVLLALGQATWWQFLASILVSVIATVGMARLAAGIYRRAILHTGRRVRLRDILATAHPAS